MRSLLGNAYSPAAAANSDAHSNPDNIAFANFTAYTYNLTDKHADSDSDAATSSHAEASSHAATMKSDDLIQEFRTTVKEPLWKLVLNWGAVMMFLGLPLLMLSIQVTYWTNPNLFLAVDPDHPRINYLLEFQRNVTVLVFGLAGLRTWENISNGKSATRQQEPIRPNEPQTIESKV